MLCGGNAKRLPLQLHTAAIIVLQPEMHER